VVAAWHKNVGDSVSSGELLAEIETDKATMEFESFQDGVLLYTGVEQGGSAPVDSILAILGEKDADFNTLIELEKLASSAASAPKIEAPVVENKKESVVVEQKIAANNAAPAASNKAAKAPAVVGKVMASPLARKLAEDRKLPLHLIPGSGDHGRIVKRDVDNFVVGGSLHNAQENFSEAPVSQMRKVIAKRLSESLFTAPHFYLTLEIDMDNAIGARKALIEAEGAKISFNDMVIKACAKALKKHPVINSSWLGDKIRTNEHVHIGVAMAVEEGLLVPVVRFADQKSLADISTTVKEYAGRAKDKKLTPEDWSGNTFTISNLGMFGIEEFTAIINPPDACILAVGGIKQVPVVKNGLVVPGNIMKFTLSCDHRVVDGATGAAFLQTVKNNLENPVLLF
jgi:pyruvate dehydrogenase E2 component (dihydrolipoamide acetyltransferase)